MRTLVLTKSHQFYPFTDFMHHTGMPVSSYLAKHGLPARMLNLPDLFIDEIRFWQLSDELTRREGLPDFGYQVGRRMTLTDLGDFGSLLLRQASLLQALRTFCVTIRAECYGVIFGLERRGDNVWLSMGNQDSKVTHSAIVELYDLQVMWRIIESATGGPWLPSSVELQASRLADDLHAETISTGPIRFSCHRTAFAIPVALLSRPMCGYQPSSYAESNILIENADAGDIDFPTQLRWLLQGYIGDKATLSDLADLLYLSERSLQRRLTESGTSFRQLQEETRFDLAKKLLHRPELSVTDIGFELGYERPANFSRAFQRWTGVSPRQYRTSVLQQ